MIEGLADVVSNLLTFIIGSLIIVGAVAFCTAFCVALYRLTKEMLNG